MSEHLLKPTIHRGGFTLIEVMVALSVFTLLAVITTTMLRSTLGNYTELRAQTSTLANVQFSWFLLKRDLSLALDYSFQQGKEPFWGNERSFTMHRIQNDMLVKIRYRCQDHTLDRTIYPGFDTTDPVKRLAGIILQSTLTRCRIHYLDDQGHEQNSWQQNTLPAAIKMITTDRTIGPITELYLIPKRALHVGV